jgi:hypothetical protein
MLNGQSDTEKRRPDFYNLPGSQPHVSAALAAASRPMDP